MREMPTNPARAKQSVYVGRFVLSTKEIGMNVEEELKSAMPEVMARIKAEAISRIEREAVAVATNVAVEAAKSWAIENLVPEIKAQLEASKGGMIQAAQDAAQGIGKAISDALVTSATERLKSSWNTKKVVEGLFG